MAQTSVCYEVYFCIDASTLLNSYSAWYLYARIQWNQHTSMYIFNDTSTPLCTYSMIPAHLYVHIHWCQHTSKFIFSDASTPLNSYSVIPAHLYVPIQWYQHTSIFFFYITEYLQCWMHYIIRWLFKLITWTCGQLLQLQCWLQSTATTMEIPEWIDEGQK